MAKTKKDNNNPPPPKKKSNKTPKQWSIKHHTDQIELSNTNHTKTWAEPLNRTEQHEPHKNMNL